MAKNIRTPAGSPNQNRIVLIGRGAGNDLVLRQPSVSARHARVLVGPDGIWIEDLGSRNGTFVGTPPRKIDRERITLDDPLVFGDAALPATALRDFLERTQPRPADDGVIHLDDAALVTFGRRAAASVPLDQPLVSALHASVAVDRGRVVVRDLGSMTGTFVDGRRIDRPVEIGPGTLVQVGDQRYRLSPDARALEPVDTSADAVEAVNVAVEAAGRRLLENVSLVIQPGEMVAIMGPSGAGKSTLLSVLNGQVAPAAGRIVIGGLDLHDHFELFRGRIGYVPQDDILHADLTVWQALWYAARLRLPKDMADDEIARRIRQVLAQLGLEGTEHTRVGDQRKRGVSGGQRKRVNLAMELLTDPPILVLDEPTSGLSSTDTISVMELLRSLADAGKTILVTIHQPSLEAYQKFDAVAVIARDASTRQVGRLAWYGRAWPDAVNFFEPPAPGTPHPTTADGLLRGLATRPVADWVRQWEQSVAKSIWVDGRAGTHAARTAAGRRPQPRPVERLSQWATLVKRGLAVKAADRWNTAVLFLQAPLVGLLVAEGVRGTGLEPCGVDPVRDHGRGEAPSHPDLGRDGLGHADPRRRLGHSPFVARRELGGGEGVEVVDRPDARRAEGHDRVGTDAVLRVHDVVARSISVERLAERRDRPQDPLPDLLAVEARERHRVHRHGRVDGTEEGRVAAAGERPHVDLVPQVRKCLRERERVDDTAAWLRRVRQQRESHGVPPVR